MRFASLSRPPPSAARPCSAGFEDHLVLSQLLGYTLSKFIGIKVVSEMDGRKSGITIIGLIALSEPRLGWLRFSAGAIQTADDLLNGFAIGNGVWVDTWLSRRSQANRSALGRSVRQFYLIVGLREVRG